MDRFDVFRVRNGMKSDLIHVITTYMTWQWFWHSWKSGRFQTEEIRHKKPVISTFIYYQLL